MKPRKNRFVLTAASALLLAPAAFAVNSNGTWNTTVTPSSWATDTNWVGNTIADGAGFTADFSTLDVPATPASPATDPTVTLDGARTIGNLIFGDTNTATAGSWILATGSEGSLTLDAGLLSPTITVNALGTGKNATITANLEGTNGLTKTGAGPLVLNFAPTLTSISGAVVLSQGNLVLSNRSLTNATSVAINAGTFVVGNTGLNAVGGTISFNGGTFQYNVTPVTDYSSQFSTADNQQYRITVISPRTATFSTPLTSAGGFLLKDGTGNLTLDAANTFTGSTRVFNSTGTLTLSNALALQNSPLDTASSIAGTIILSGVTSPTFGGLTGNKQLSTMFNSTTGNYGSVTNVTLNPGTGASYSYSGVLDNGAADMTLTKSGAGTQTLTVANTYTGGTIISGGTLNYGNATALSSGAISFTGNSTLQAGVATTLANNISVASGFTGTVDTNGNATTLGGTITGDGNLTKTGTSSLTLTGGVVVDPEAPPIPPLLGAINVNTGRLISTNGWSLKNMTGPITVAAGAGLTFSQNFINANNLTNALNLSGAGTNATTGALHIYGNATASGPITLDDDTTITHSFNNAWLTNSITGANRNLTLKTTTAGQFPLTISGPIQLGSGGITVNASEVGTSGNNIVILSGNNTYSGETHVVTGELKLTGSARIPNASTVRIDSGAVLHLDFAGTDTVGDLYLPGDPNPKADGTYGSFTSTATNQSADFLGDGILQVGGATDNYESWASSQVPPVVEGPNGDDDKDGVKNLVEYALVNGGERGVLSGNTITFTKRGGVYGGDLTYDIESSIDLVGWGVLAKPPVVEDASSISYTFTPGSPMKNFARLKVVQAP
jgi:autotransporter-associated beta strand protein